jgi:hypothetical protein
MKKIEWILDIQLKSEANISRFWAKRRKITQTQKLHVRYKFFNDRPNITLPCHIKLTRISPRELDYDNLVHAFKWIRDEIEDNIKPGLAHGRADDDKRFTWEYLQDKGLHAVKVEIIF